MSQCDGIPPQLPSDHPTPRQTKAQQRDKARQPLSFPVVGVGASAGGLEAFTRLLQHIPSDTGMAFVLVQHLAPQSESMLASLLSRATGMQVREAETGTPVRPNHVYVIPPNTRMSIMGGVLQLEPRSDARCAPRPIDHFFRSLALDQTSLAIGIVLSGTDSDGAMGLQAIRAEGGIAIVQTEVSAKYPEMPRAALAAGTIDLVLSPEEIGGELSGIGRHSLEVSSAITGELDGGAAREEDLNRIFKLLRDSHGVDFRGYKRGTIIRRIRRRIVLSGADNPESYAFHLESNPTELLALSEDLLINVTSFFRDPESFLALENEVLPSLMGNREGDAPLRIWIPGCSTGEEAYSLAMCIMEASSKRHDSVPFQIFGTDVSERAIASARGGVYSEIQLTGFSPKLLERFFTREDNGYRIAKCVRETCVFARQNLFTDPPFSHLDLISCRNVLIYLEPVLQRQVIATFHYALRPEGYLVLGHAEGPRDLADLFQVSNKEHRFYRRKQDRPPLSTGILGHGFARPHSTHVIPSSNGLKSRPAAVEIERTAERIVLSDYAPAWVAVNEDWEVIHSRGNTSPYLQFPAGRATLSLLKMARENIRGELRRVLANAKAENAVQTHVLCPDVNGLHGVRLEVRRIANSAVDGPCFLVVFIPVEQGPSPALPAGTASSRRRNRGPAESAETERLRQELALTTQKLEAIIDERNSANQDLTFANEEIQSSNEELQSINEELETSKEELQSSNEELNTVNEELEKRNRELNRLGDDLANLLSSTTIPIVMLDNQLRIRRFTPTATKVLNVRPTDIGRPIEELRTRVSLEDVAPIVRRVLETLGPEEIELRDRDGCWYALRVRPYRTADNRIEGAVLALIDIDHLRRAELAAVAARDFAESVIESLRTPLLVLRSDLHVRIANKAFYKLYGVKQSDLEGRSLWEAGDGRWNIPELRTALERLSTGGVPMDELEVEQRTFTLDMRTVSINAQRVPIDGAIQILVAMEDITAHRQAQRILFDERERLRGSVAAASAELERTETTLKGEVLGRTEAEAALHETEAALLRSRGELRALAASLLNTQEEERRRVSRELHDDLNQKMAKLQFDIERLEQQLPAALGDVKARLLGVRDDVGALANDVRRIAHQLHPSTLDHLGLPVALRAFARDFAEREGVQVQFTVRKVPDRIPPAVGSTLYRVLQEALRNIAKHAGKTTVEISLTGSPNKLSMKVRDHGVGFDAGAAGNCGGLGLISMQERVRLVNGKFSLQSRPGAGVTIQLHVPLG